MPFHGNTKADALTARVKVQFTPAQSQSVSARADALGMTLAGYLRSLALNDIGQAEPTTTKARLRKQEHLAHVAELHALAMQVKRLGTNVNQLAHQANVGMVPLARAEVIYMLNQHQVLMSQAEAAVERMLA